MTEEKKPSGEIVDQLHALGEQLVTAVKALWDSEDARKVRQEIGDGFVELSHQVDEAIQTARESEATKEFETKVKETVDKARESDVAGQVQEGLVTGLRQLNEEMSKLVGSLTPSEAPEADAAASAGEDAETEAEA
jgi:flagellar biosynthesis/type III secretory pathway protein FliH